MKSPFPGMDPYLEGYLQPDIHHALANEIRKQLMPLVRPHYVGRLAVTILHESTLYGEIETRIVDVEIYDVAKNQLITSIEILSPVNKREPGLTKYREKQERLRQAGIHLLEIDLLRGGKRRSVSPFMQNYKAVNDAHYLVTLTRSSANSCNVWPINLQDELPVVAVPLRAPDLDIPLDLAAAFKNIYEEAAYDLSIDYNADPPPPVLKESDAKWIQELLIP